MQAGCEKVLSAIESALGRQADEVQSGDVHGIARFVTTELNYFFDEHGGEAYDYKSTFKSQSDVVGIRNEVLKAFEKDVARDRAKWFTLPEPEKGKRSGK